MNLLKSLLKFSVVAVLPLAQTACTSGEGHGERDLPILTGPYLGQSPPGQSPELFAPGIVSTGMFTRDVAISPDGKEIYFCVAIGNYTYSTILYTRLENRG